MARDSELVPRTLAPFTWLARVHSDEQLGFINLPSPSRKLSKLLLRNSAGSKEEETCLVKVVVSPTQQGLRVTAVTLRT